MEDARRVVLYCRESRDENGENFERIETQRDILLDFCRRRQLNNIVGIILDDDKSGTDFSRFDSIVRAAQRREIDVLVFKDSSRLGRNLRESLNFIEQMQRLGFSAL
ncbi:MAG: recombinase family protein [Oscillospiraceae bacterium]